MDLATMLYPNGAPRNRKERRAGEARLRQFLSIAQRLQKNNIAPPRDQLFSPPETTEAV